MNLFGLHYMVDAHGCDHDAIRSFDTIKEFIKKLVNDIDMKSYGEPILLHFGEEERVMGITAIQLIETSNITIHFAEYTNSMYFDLFSCKEYDINIVKQLIEQYFKPKSYTKELIVKR